MKKVILFFVLSTTLVFSKEITLSQKKKIYGCFNEINTPTERSFILIFRNSEFESSDPIINLKENKNSILVIKKYKSHVNETFEVSRLNFTSKSSGYAKVEDGWSPKDIPETIFTARDELKAFSIQNEISGFFVGNYSEYAYKDIQLICTSNKNLVKELFLKVTSN